MARVGWYRSDHMVDRSDDDTKPDHGQTGCSGSIAAGVEPRRKAQAEEKLASMAGSLVEGVVISELARRHAQSIVRGGCPAGAAKEDRGLRRGGRAGR
jgi:hypothetical protein